MPKIMNGRQKRKIMKREMALAMRENCKKTKRKHKNMLEEDLINMITQSEM